MKDGKIKIAVWNIYGPPPGKQFEKTAHKIKAFQDEVHPDIAFYLEAPERKIESLPGRNLNAMRAGKSKPERKIESLPGVDPRCWKKTFWVGTGQQGNPRGILVVCYDKDIRIEEERPKNPMGGTALGIRVYSDETELLRILGVWTTPSQKSNSQTVYLETLEQIMSDYDKMKFFSSSPRDPVCIVVGDTNVNLLAAAKSETEIKETRRCLINRTELLENDRGFAKKHSFSLYDDPPLNQNTLKKNGKWYRCDLLFVSDKDKIVSAELGNLTYTYKAELGNLTYTYKDEERKGYEEVVGSDHRPIIFEVSVADRLSRTIDVSCRRLYFLP